MHSAKKQEINVFKGQRASGSFVNYIFLNPTRPRGRRVGGAGGAGRAGRAGQAGRDRPKRTYGRGEGCSTNDAKAWLRNRGSWLPEPSRWFHNWNGIVVLNQGHRDLVLSWASGKPWGRFRSFAKKENIGQNKKYSLFYCLSGTRAGWAIRDGGVAATIPAKNKFILTNQSRNKNNKFYFIPFPRNN